MSTQELGTQRLATPGQPAVRASSNTIRLHRLKEVRREQGVSARRMAQHLGVDLDQVHYQEQETTDLTLRQVYAWQQALEVPIADLLVESNSPLSTPVLQRARLVRLMKTAAALSERSDTSTLRRLSATLIAQLVEIMPELEGITPCNTNERRRSRDSQRIARHVLAPDNHWLEA